MKTLIELYDDRPIENVLSTEVFHPEETILLCPLEAAADRRLKETIEGYFAYRNISAKFTIVQVSMLDATKIERQLEKILETHEDCAIEISGGTEAALFAAGVVSGETPVFTFSRKKNTFFEIKNAPFARNLPCQVQLDAAACFKLAGGRLLPGREDNRLLKDHLPQIVKMFKIFGKYRKIWRTQVTYIQKISSSEPGKLLAKGSRTMKADHGIVTGDAQMLRDLAGQGLLYHLEITKEQICFQFPDELVRFWLRDIGAVLELEVYRACLEAGCFQDVVLSAIVNWEGRDSQRNTVTNEIDVMAVRGIWPVFISCKTSEIKTEALNEIAVLRDRFGGKGSRAMIVTSAPATRGRALMRRRAFELGIEVVEWDDLATGKLAERLRQG